MKQKSSQSVMTVYVISMLTSIFTLFYIMTLFVEKRNFVLLGLIIPFISSLISVKIALGNKEIKFDNGLNKKVIIANIIIVAVMMLLMRSNSILVWLIYLGIAFIPVLIYSIKRFNKVMQKELPKNSYSEKSQEYDNSTSKENLSNNINGEIHIKETELNALKDEDIRNFLKNIGLQTENYFFATRPPSVGAFLLFGMWAAATMTCYIIAFDNTNVYMFELSKLSNKVIINCDTISWRNINIRKYNSYLFGTKYEIKVDINNTKMLLEATKKFKGIENQRDSLEKFLKL